LIKLEKISSIILVIGAMGSVGLTLYTGRNNPSIFLIAMFVAWVLSPFAGLWIADKISRRWYPVGHRAIYVCMWIVTAASIIAYSGGFNTAETKTAFMFLVIPLASWVLLGSVLIAINLSRKRK
jgi:hypothetical protein